MGEEKAPSLRESAKNALEIIADSPTLKALAQTIGVSLAGPVGAILVQWGVGRGEQFRALLTERKVDHPLGC
jgi:hypothetical protein